MKQSRSLTRLLLCSAALALVSGCSMMPDSKKIEYKSEGKKARPLEIPPDLMAPERDGRYAMPAEPGSRSGPTTYSAYTGERQVQVAQGNTDVLPTIGEMRIERSGSQRWLVVPGVPPEKLWDTVKEFWQENGMLINVETPQAGIMETDWNENRAKLPQDGLRKFFGRVLDSVYSTSELDKYRTRLEKTTDGGTEIYISHRGMSELYITEEKADTRWQPRPPDPELEAEMLRRLMSRLGAEEGKTKVMAAEVVKQDRAKLNRSGPGGTTLVVSEPFDRAWRRVGLALDRVGFTVEDRDRSQGVYYVRYVDPDADLKTKKNEGWLSKMAFWKSSDDKDLNKNSQFRIHIKGSGDSSTVQVLTKEGGVDAGAVSGKILGLLYEQLK
jgi:outer membrane protein assembly factor BamC